MSCEEFQILINRDLDGVLLPGEEKRLSGHVATCGACSSHQASLQAMHGAFRDLRHVDVPPGLADRIIANAAVPRTPMLRIPRYALIPAAAAVLALCAISGALGWRAHESDAIMAGPPRPRLEESEYRKFLRETLALPEDRVESVLKVRHEFDQRLDAAKAELDQKREVLHRQEIDEIWKLLPPDSQERYRKHDPTFEAPR